MSCIKSIAKIKGKITSKVVLKNSGINSVACPIILCIDGGASDTAVYPSINGLLNGGSS